SSDPTRIRSRVRRNGRRRRHDALAVRKSEVRAELAPLDAARRGAKVGAIRVRRAVAAMTLGNAERLAFVVVDADAVMVAGAQRFAAIPTEVEFLRATLRRARRPAFERDLALVILVFLARSGAA